MFTPPHPHPHPFPPRFMPHPPPPFPPANPFPTLDTEPMATRAELEAEVARAMAAESGIVAAAIEAASGTLDDLRGSVTGAVASAESAVSGAIAAAQEVRSVTSGMIASSVSSAVPAAVSGYFASGGRVTQIADEAAMKAASVLSASYATQLQLAEKAGKGYVDACLKQAVLMTQSPDGLSQIQIGNDGVPKVVIARPFKAIWTDSNSGEHRFSWNATDGSDSVGTPEYHYPEDESTATSGREIILREAKNGAYLSITDAGVTRGVWANYPVYSGGVFSGANIVAYNPRVSVRNIALEAAQ